MPQAEFQEIALGDLAPSPSNPRSIRTKGAKLAIEDLVPSIRALGVVQPLAVRRDGDGYVILAGERRFRAAKKVGLATVPCAVFEVDDDVADAITITENHHRLNLHPLQEAEGIARAVDDQGKSPQEVAALLGVDVATIYRRMQLRALHPGIKKLYLEHDSSIGSWGIRHLELCASYPKETQEQVLSALDWNPPRSVVGLRSQLDAHGQNLAVAPWSLEDAELTDAGPCVGCTSNTGSHGQLFGDLDEAPSKCLDSPCWSLKWRVWVQRRYDAAVAKLGDELVVVAATHRVDLDALPAFGRDVFGFDARWQVVEKSAKGAVPAFVAVSHRDALPLGSVAWVKFPKPGQGGGGEPAAPPKDSIEAKLARAEELLKRKRFRSAVPALLRAAKEVGPPSRIQLLRLLFCFGGPYRDDHRDNRGQHDWPAQAVPKKGQAEGYSWQVFEAIADDGLMLDHLWRQVQAVVASRLDTKPTFRDFDLVEAEAQGYCRLLGLSWEDFWAAARKACPPSKALVARRATVG